MTPVDDLRRGDWVAVVGCNMDRPRDWFGNEKPVAFDGLPLRILAISLPFLCVDCQGKTLSLDVRAWDVKKVSRHYARAMSGVAPKQPRRRRARPQKGHCPRCGERLCERLDATTNFIWRHLCPN